MKPHFKEQKMQIRCVRYFRVTYPELAMLLYHPKNEVSSGNRTEGAIAKAEGVVAGVADLMLNVPSVYFLAVDGVVFDATKAYHSLAMELKEEKRGRQSAGQKLFQRYFQASGGLYVIIRSYEDFCTVVDQWVAGIPYEIHKALLDLWKQIEKEKTEQARQELDEFLSNTK